MFSPWQLLAFFFFTSIYSYFWAIFFLGFFNTLVRITNRFTPHDLFLINFLITMIYSAIFLLLHKPIPSIVIFDAILMPSICILFALRSNILSIMFFLALLIFIYPKQNVSIAEIGGMGYTCQCLGIQHSVASFSMNYEVTCAGLPFFCQDHPQPRFQKTPPLTN